MNESARSRSAAGAMITGPDGVDYFIPGGPRGPYRVLVSPGSGAHRPAKVDVPAAVRDPAAAPGTLEPLPQLPVNLCFHF
jgi:hypothetical protein